jgi:hypothetical protein
MANRINPRDIPERHKLAAKLMGSIIADCKENKLRTRGNCIIEDGLGLPMGMTFAAYENGNYMVWFTDAGMYHLYALVNEKFQHVFSIADNEKNVKRLQVKLDQLKKQLEP